MSNLSGEPWSNADLFFLSNTLRHVWRWRKWLAFSAELHAKCAPKPQNCMCLSVVWAAHDTQRTVTGCKPTLNQREAHVHLTLRRSFTATLLCGDRDNFPAAIRARRPVDQNFEQRTW